LVALRKLNKIGNSRSCLPLCLLIYITEIGGSSTDGLIASLSIVGSVNINLFLFYIQEILIPQLWVGAIIVMDNLPVHHPDYQRVYFR
jgi:hypothetical protein